jgi:hypothetical protein
MIFGTPLESYLDPGETLIWSGQPKQGLRLQAGDIFMIPFSLIWGGFAFFWESLALGIYHPAHGHTNATPFMALFGLPFCVIGIYVIIGRFFADALTRRKTWYGITDRRLIILRRSLGTALTSLDLANLSGLNLVERKDNSGDIRFGVISDLAMYGSRRIPLVPGFYLLPQARTVYNLIRELQGKVRK